MIDINIVVKRYNLSEPCLLDNFMYMDVSNESNPGTAVSVTYRVKTKNRDVTQTLMIPEEAEPFICDAVERMAGMAIYEGIKDWR